MKLNMDCVRELLLAMQDCQMDEEMTIPDFCERLPQYTEDDIRYSCLKMSEAGFIIADTTELDGWMVPQVDGVIDITFRGHEFLAKIKDESRWQGIKKVLPAIRDYSVDAISAVANGFASAAISAFFSSSSKQ